METMEELVVSYLVEYLKKPADNASKAQKW